MHSIYESTVEATSVLVPWLQEQGYQLVTVTELLAYYYGELPQPDHFYGYTYFSTHGRTDTPVELPSMYPPEEPEAEPAPEQDPVPDTPDAPPESFDPTGIVPAPTPEPEPAAVPEPAEPAQELPALSSGQDVVRETLSPSISIPNPAMFYP